MHCDEKNVKRSCTHLFQQKEGEKKEQGNVVSKTFVVNEKIFFKKFTAKYMAIIGSSGVFIHGMTTCSVMKKQMLLVKSKEKSTMSCTFAEAA